MLNRKPISTTVKLKRAAITIGVLGYLAGAAAGTAYGSAALYQLFHKMLPTKLHLSTTYRYWQLAADDKREQKLLLLALFLPAAALFFVLPMAALTMGSKRRELHGSARFANTAEIAKSGLLKGAGILLGQHKGRYLALGGQQSVLLAAPPRSGKGVGIVIPNLLSWPDSTVVLDVKAENFEKTAGFRAKFGQQVFAWAPFSKEARTHRYNPLSVIRAHPNHVISDSIAIAQMIYAVSDHMNGTEKFFNGRARNLFLGLTLYLVETPALPRSMGELFRQASGKGQSLDAHIRQLIAQRAQSERPLSDACVDSLQRFLAEPDNTRGGTLSTFTEPLLIFADPLVDAATAGSDFIADDLRKKRISIYVTIPADKLDESRVLINLFFSQLINRNTQELPEQNPELKYQLLVLLDEGTAPGRIGILAKSLGYLPGYNIRVLTVIQAASQLESAYGKEDARSMMTNHAAQIVYAPREQRDANEYSEMLGTFTDKSESQGRSNSLGTRGGSSRSTNIGPARRALLLPQEFKELGQRKAVILLENSKPILAGKICYYDDPTFMPRLLDPPAIPLVDLELHRARVEQRVRDATDSDVFSANRLVFDFDALPSLTPDAQPAELAAFVATFLAQVSFDSSADTGANTHADIDPVRTQEFAN
jgi:type IV secretion system protein VirD4